MRKDVTPLGQRLEDIRFAEKKNKAEFCEVIGFSSSSTYNLLIQGGKNLSINVLEAVIEKFKWVNLHWFLTGVGEMSYPNGSAAASKYVAESQVGYTTKTPTNQPINANEFQVSKMQSQIRLLEEKLNGTEQQLLAKDEIIKTKNELIELLREKKV